MSTTTPTTTYFDFSKPESWTLDDCQVIKLQLVAERQQLSAHAMKLKLASEQLVTRADGFRVEKISFGVEKESLLNEIHQLKLEIDDLKDRLEFEMLKSTMVQNKATTDEIDSLKKEMVVLKHEVEQFVDKCDTLRWENGQINEKYNTLKTENTAIEIKYQSLEVEKQVVQVKCDGFLAKNEALQKENDILRREYLQQQQEIARIKEQLARFSTDGLAAIGIETKIEEKNENLPKCLRNHSLKKTSTYGGHRCDVCRISLPSTVKHWRCTSGCDWDSCEGCYDKTIIKLINQNKDKPQPETTTTTTTTTTTPTNPPTPTTTTPTPPTPQKIKCCPRNHTLRSNFPRHAGFTCDGCKSSIWFGTIMKSCRQCDFDLCPNCAAK